MSTVEQNIRKWNVSYDWPEGGEEWSSSWGGSEAQWFSAILPRIRTFIPTGTILEIAPGFGRWTNYLRNYCEHLVAVDLAEACIKACQQRFAGESHISYHLNDGKSLKMIPDKSIDFVFSFDSLVHAETDVMQEYLDQLAKKLTANGACFIHHSNIGEYRRIFSWFEKIPARLRDFLAAKGYVDSNEWRAFSMTARVFEGQCNAAGLQCIGQEMVNWGTKRLIDCFSTITLKSSKWARP